MAVLESAEHDLRKPCACGAVKGRIATKNGQDCVYCATCGKYQYNAPKTETGREVRSLQTTHEAIKAKQRVRIICRGNGRCELCGKSGNDAVLSVGHVISVQRGHEQGMTDEEINNDENLACVCADCNLGLGKEPMPVRFAVKLLFARLAHQKEHQQ